MRSPRVLVLALALACAFAAAPFVRAEVPAPAYQVIVNSNNPVTIADRQYLEDAFLKKITMWPAGGVIRPVDLVPRSPVRHRFTEDVLRRSVEAVRVYWQQRIFSGRDLPPELDADEEVINYVLKYDGAVGYVSGTVTTHGCRALTVR